MSRELEHVGWLLVMLDDEGNEITWMHEYPKFISIRNYKEPEMGKGFRVVRVYTEQLAGVPNGAATEAT